MEKEILSNKVMIRFTDTDLGKIDSYANKLRITRSHMIRNLTLIGLDDVNILHRFGILSLIGFIRDRNINPKDIVELGSPGGKKG